MLTVVRNIKNQLRVMFLSIKYNIVRLMTNKASFLFSVLLMFISNASFLIQWIVIFSVSKDIDLTIKDVLLIWGIAASAIGLSNILFCGVHYLPSYIVNGNLDAYLVQPKNVLLSIATSQISMSAFGDLLYGYIIVLIASPSIKTLIFLSFYALFGAIIYASFTVIYYSFIFISISFRDAASSMINLMTAFATYPKNIFNGFIKVILYTIAPVGFIIYFPVDSLLTNDIVIFIKVLLFTIFSVCLAFLMFYRGLKKYSSTNLMEMRG